MFICVLCLGQICFSQDGAECDTFYTYVDEEPKFEGGTRTFQKWILEIISYDKITPIDVSEVGRIIVSMKLSHEGEIIDISLNSNSLNAQELEEFKSSAPNILPGKIRGNPVCTRILVPIQINLN